MTVAHYCWLQYNPKSVLLNYKRHTVKYLGKVIFYKYLIHSRIHSLFVYSGVSRCHHGHLCHLYETIAVSKRDMHT